MNYKSALERYMSTTKMTEELAFQNVKPKSFTYIDELVKSFDWHPEYQLYIKELIEYADRRMIMGDLRYGPIYRPDLSKYDTSLEYYKRMDRYFKEGLLEYIIDAYNMIRIEYCKHKNIPISKEALYSDLKHYIKDRGQLLKEVISIDDGIHAEKVES
jgi:hypothetical protein